jgi:hypothetical protein
MATGAVVNAVNDAAAGVVSFTVGGTLIGRSESHGGFSVGFPSTGSNRTVLSASGFVERQTNIAAPGSGLQLSLIPASPSFNLAAFDQMFRHAQVGGSGPGLTRWTSAPSLVIERRVVQFTNVCAFSYQGLEDSISGADTDAIITDMRDGFQLLTAGRLGPLASVTTQTAEPGATVIPRQSGKIVVMRAAGLFAADKFWGYACWSTTADGEVTGGFILLDKDFEENPSPFHRSLRMHELGHTLGCQHVTGTTSVMNSNARTEPNQFDQQAARIAMLRPTGNRTPDIDPVSHFATTTALRAAGQPLTWHGAH